MLSAHRSGRPEDCLSGGGEMGALMRATDWGRTPIGPVASWPQSLRTAVSILLESGFPMYIAWGPQFTQFYNDGYRPILGSTKHPALGKGTPETFAEIWDIVGPMFQRVLGGEAVNVTDYMLPLDRHGFTEECYFIFSYSPIRDETGGVGGILVTVTETTRRVLSARRTATLREMAAGASAVTSEAEAWRVGVEVLARNGNDIPFVAAHRAGEAEGPWPLEAALRGEPAAIPDVQARRPGLAGTEWREAVERAVALPVRRKPGETPYGALLVGLSPRQTYDEDYRTFLEMAAEQLGASVAAARAHEEERRRAEALAELDRAKTAFFHNISHEFRTPLTLQLTPLEEILSDPQAALAPDQRDKLEIVHRNSLRLLKLVNSLLEFSRIEAGRARAARVPTDLGRLTREIASSFEGAMARARLDYRVTAPEEPVAAAVDRDMWERIVLNLVSNAFKFTLQGRIEVRVAADGDRVLVEVEDTGCGIPREELGKVFERFHRIEGQKARTHEGTGIGLALVRDLVALHEGTIEVESEVGRGTTFRILLPRVREAPPEAPAASSTEARGFVSEASRWIPAQRPDPSQGEPAGHRDRILVADDNADMRDYLASILEPHFRVILAADGREALHRVRAEEPALVLTDVMMPNLDGIGLLRALRADGATRALPVILLSARAGEEDAARGFDARADDYVVKPFVPAELVARIRAHLALARERAAASGRIREILDQLPAAFFAFDREWRVTYQNTRAKEVLAEGSQGTFADITGRVLWDLIPGLAQTSFGKLYQRAMAERIPLRLEDRFAPFERWYEVFAYPIADGLAVVSQDVTARKEGERTLEEIQRALAASQRLAALGGLVAGLAHEIRTPLTAIRTTSATLRLRASRAKGPEEAARLTQALPATLTEMEGAVDRINETVAHLKRFTRQQESPREAAPLHEVAADALAILQAAFRDRAIVARLAPTPPAVVDRTRLQQVIINLVENAVEAGGPHGSQVVVETFSAEGGRAAGIAVQDNGPGIPPEVQARMFEPLFTTKREGTGLGLAIVKQIVEEHGGTLRWESRPGGTRFDVRLPAVGTTGG